MKEAHIRQLEAASLSELPTDGIDQWFWVDTDKATNGVHFSAELPENIPPFATHIWGWNITQFKFIRIRCDLSLKNGFTALLLEKTEATDNPDNNCVVREIESEHLRWGLKKRFNKVYVMAARRKAAPETSVEFIKLTGKEADPLVSKVSTEDFG